MSPDRNHVFHLKMPPSWKNQDIEELFSAVGELLSFFHKSIPLDALYQYAFWVSFNFCLTGPIQIAWIDDTSSYVALKRRDMAAEALIAKVPSNDSLYQVTTYADFCAESLLDCERRRGEKRQKLEEINSWGLPWYSIHTSFGKWEISVQVNSSWVNLL